MAAAGTGEGAHYTEARLSSLVASQDLEAWNVFARDVLEEVAPSEASAAAVACALHQLRVAARTNLAFAIDAGKALLAAAAHRGAGWGAVLFDVREAVAEWCVRAGDEAQAQELWRAMLPAETGTVTLRLLTNFLNSAIRTRSYAVAETECLRGLSTYKALSMRPEANNEVNNFLLAFASLLAARRRFVEAAQRFYELYLRTKVLSHLREAIVCVIQADASAARSRLLKTLYKDESAVLLGELHTILSRACHTHLLRPSELQRFLPYVEPSADASAAVERAFIQHNLQAISRVYYNIGFTELGALLGITASEAERLVAQMVSERRLDASLDQTTDTVFFSRSDNASSLEAWDAKITSVCEELACVADLIVRQHAEFNEYLLLNLFMSPEACTDAAHKWFVLLALGVVLGSGALSYNAVWERRRTQAEHLAQLLLKGRKKRKPQNTGHTNQEVLYTGISLPSFTASDDAAADFSAAQQKQKQQQQQQDAVHGVDAVQDDFSLSQLRETPVGHKMSDVPSTQDVSLAYSAVKTAYGGTESVSSGGASLRQSSNAHGRDSRVMIGDLSVIISKCFTPEAELYRFPIELKRYIHTDWSQLTLVAEDLGATEENLTTEAYKTKCIEHVRELAEQQQTYFKVQYDTSASVIVTTIMELFVSINIGPSPTVTASFFLVRNHMAYTIQLQALVDCYEARLADLFPTIQSARIANTPRAHPGQLCHALRPTLGGSTYLVYTPLPLVATRTSAGDTLALRHRHVSGWSGEVLTWAPKSKDGNDDISVELVPGTLYLVSHWHLPQGKARAAAMEEVKPLFETLSASIVPNCGKQLPSSFYVSDVMKLRLPPIHLFTTTVCSHTADPFVNVFVQSKFSGLFEFEFGTVSVSDVGDFALLMNPLFLKLARPQLGVTAEGNKRVTFLGETENGMMLRIDAVRTTEMAGWYVVKCLYARDSEVPPDLLQYIETIFDGFSLFLPSKTSIASPGT